MELMGKHTIVQIKQNVRIIQGSHYQKYIHNDRNYDTDQDM